VKLSIFFLPFLLSVMTGCSDNGDDTTEDTDNETETSIETGSGSIPDFTVIANSDTGYGMFDRKINVFGIPIYAVKEVDEQKLVHAANIMAQYLDNNEDGTVDDAKVLSNMLAVKAFLFMWKTEIDFDPPADAQGQDLGNDETHPEWHTNDHTGEFDRAIEEVWHLVTNKGYSNAYPTVFGEGETGTTLTTAMDVARGGQFTQIPTPYPENAWYTYDDETCDYSCMAGEYIYWTMSAILGAQANRLAEIDNEWKLHTKALVQEKDPAAYALLTSSQYPLPTTLPDGSYRQ